MTVQTKNRNKKNTLPVRAVEEAKSGIGETMVKLNTTWEGTLTTTIILVLGANIGGALPPLMNAGSARVCRLPVGNLFVRICGCLLALALLSLLTPLTEKMAHSSAHLVTGFHTVFNTILALLFIGFTEPLARLLERLFPEEPRPADAGMPIYLHEAGLDVAYIGLSNSVRESLRMDDMLTMMLDRLLLLLVCQEKQTADDIRQLDDAVDQLSAAVRAYLADIGQDGLNDSDADRAQEILMFIIKVEHAGDILASNLTQLVMRRARRGEPFSEFELHNIRLLHSELLASLRLAIAAFLREDLSAAQQLILPKESIRQLEAAARQAHLKKLREDKSTWAESGDIFQPVLKDYRQVQHHIAAVAFPVIDKLGGYQRQRCPQQQNTYNNNDSSAGLSPVKAS